jgi:hypothetical protein
MQQAVSRQRQYVGIELHRRCSVIVRMDQQGQVLGIDQVLNDPVQFPVAMAKAGPGPKVALGSTYGWYWAADLLEAHGAHVHLVHPLGLHGDVTAPLPAGEPAPSQPAPGPHRDGLPASFPAHASPALKT